MNAKDISEQNKAEIERLREDAIRRDGQRKDAIAAGRDAFGKGRLEALPKLISFILGSGLDEASGWQMAKAISDKRGDQSGFDGTKASTLNMRIYRNGDGTLSIWSGTTIVDVSPKNKDIQEVADEAAALFCGLSKREYEEAKEAIEADEAKIDALEYENHLFECANLLLSPTAPGQSECASVGGGAKDPRIEKREDGKYAFAIDEIGTRLLCVSGRDPLMQLGGLHDFGGGSLPEIGQGRGEAILKLIGIGYEKRYYESAIDSYVSEKDEAVLNEIRERIRSDEEDYEDAKNRYFSLAAAARSDKAVEKAAFGFKGDKDTVCIGEPGSGVEIKKGKAEIDIRVCGAEFRWSGIDDYRSRVSALCKDAIRRLDETRRRTDDGRETLRRTADNVRTD
jgi:hypothetical protein